MLPAVPKPLADSAAAHVSKGCVNLLALLAIESRRWAAALPSAGTRSAWLAAAAAPGSNCREGRNPALCWLAECNCRGDATLGLALPDASSFTINASWHGPAKLTAAPVHSLTRDSARLH